MRHEHLPYRMKIAWHWLQRIYGEKLLEPQFDALGPNWMIVNPWNVEVVGENITIGDCLHMIAVKDRPITFTTWIMGASLGKISLGNYCLVSPGVRIASATSVEIGDNTMLAQGVYISDADWHGIYDRAEPIGKTAPVIIGENVWLCDDVSIGKGVTIGDNSIIAAGAIVVRDIPSNVIAGGNPAKVIRELEVDMLGRKREDLFDDPDALAREMDAIYRYTLHKNTLWGWLKSIVARNRTH